MPGQQETQISLWILSFLIIIIVYLIFIDILFPVSMCLVTSCHNTINSNTLHCQVVVTVELSKWNRRGLTIWKIDNGYACVSGILRVGVRSNEDGRCNNVGMHKFKARSHSPLKTWYVIAKLIFYEKYISSKMWKLTYVK
jgi:hypothetical protein